MGEEEFTLKVCTKCLVEQPLENYYKRAASKDGLRPQCKSCVGTYREQRRQYYEDNREAILARAKEYREANAEKLAAKRKALRETDGDRLSARSKAYYEANREETLARQKARFAANPEEMRAKHRAKNERWIKNNPDKVRAYWHKRRAAMKATEYDPEVTRESLRERDGDYCCYCGVRMFFGYVPRTESKTNQVTLEHITCVDRGGDHTFDNTALCCKSCNSSKRVATFLWEWVGRGF